MDDKANPTPQEKEDITDLKDIEVELVFELGRKSMPLAEVGRIGPGYLFDLAADFSKLVTIHVNGRRIGDGELVKIDNHLGVRLIHYHARKAGPL